MARGLPLKVEGSTTGVPSAGASLCVTGREEAVLALRVAAGACVVAHGAGACAAEEPAGAVELL